MSDQHTTQNNSGANDTQSLADKANGVLRDLKSKAAGVADTAGRMANENASHIADAAKDMAGKARAKAEDAVDKQKSIGADYIQSLAKAADRAANEFQNETPQAAELIRQASAQIQSLADTVRQRDLREFVGDVQEFARRQPTIFFGGAIVLGFAALRFFKSAAPKSVEMN